ncbi:MAG TPA: hypothetical protein GXZ21_08825 [Clostridiales bacterium]|jgi:hypothetical protein|nr:hypothetical protein [Clostridiales bacterium]
MNYEEFKEKAVLELQKRLHQTKVEVSEIYKNNSTSYDTIMIHKSNKELSLSPCIRLKPYYNDFINSHGKKSFEDILQNIVEEYHNALGCKKGNALYDEIKDFNTVKDHVICRLVNRLMNQALLETIPHTEYLGEFAIIYSIVTMQNGDGVESIRITNSIMGYWNITLEELHEISLQNTIRLFPKVSIRMDDLISNMIGEPMPEQEAESCNMYVLTNSQSINGATVLIYPDTLKEFISQHHINEKYLVILPSSIHEVIAVPATDLSMIDNFLQMVKEVNKGEVAAEEVLSYKILVYNRIENSLNCLEEE